MQSPNYFVINRFTIQTTRSQHLVGTNEAFLQAVVSRFQYADLHLNKKADSSQSALKLDLLYAA